MESIATTYKHDAPDIEPVFHGALLLASLRANKHTNYGTIPLTVAHGRNHPLAGAITTPSQVQAEATNQ